MIFGFQAVQLCVEVEAFLDAGHVFFRHEHFHVGFDGHVANVLAGRFFQFFGKYVLKVRFLEFDDRLFQDFLVGLVANVHNEATLLCAQQVACPPDVEVAHGDVETTAQIRKFLQGFEPFAGVAGEGR